MERGCTNPHFPRKTCPPPPLPRMFSNARSFSRITHAYGIIATLLACIAIDGRVRQITQKSTASVGRRARGTAQSTTHLTHPEILFPLVPEQSFRCLERGHCSSKLLHLLFVSAIPIQRAVCEGSSINCTVAWSAPPTMVDDAYGLGRPEVEMVVL